MDMKDLRRNRGGRIQFDNDSKDFYFQSRAEVLQQNSERQDKCTRAINNGEQRRLGALNCRVEKARRLYNMKNERETTYVRDSLRDMVAYREVLRKVSRLNEHDPYYPSETYGMYGPKANKEELADFISSQKKLLTPAQIRRDEARRLLQQRRSQEDPQWRLKTPYLVRHWRGRSNTYTEDAFHPRPHKPLVLPPLHAPHACRPFDLSTPLGPGGKGRHRDPVFITQSHTDPP